MRETEGKRGRERGRRERERERKRVNGYLLDDSRVIHDYHEWI